MNEYEKKVIELLLKIEENTRKPEKQVRKQVRFVKPTIPEIKEHCLASGIEIDPVAFYNFYESKGWKVGSAPMKSWPAACRTWARNGK